ncbi:MAG: HAMP domain-containing protein [Myxococcales bacterium FL481]|nr:MAG: HAMP domain-containing protein [Myxococcales bacterium FL481]
MALLSVALAVLPTLTAGVALLDANADALEVTNRELQIAVAEHAAVLVDGYLEASASELETVGRALTRRDLPQDQRLELALTLVDTAEHLDHVVIYDRHGRFIDAISDTSPGEDRAPLNAAVRETAASTGRVYGETSPGPDRRMRVVVPLVARDEVTGFVGSAVVVGPVAANVESLSDAHFRGVSHAIVVLDEQHRPLTSESLELDPGVQQVLTAAPPSPRLAQSLDLRPQGSPPQVATVIGLASRPWSVLIRVPQPVAYASLFAARRFIGSGVLLVAVISGLLGWLYANRLTKPLVRLTEHARALAQQDYAVRTHLDGSDEIGTLGRALDQASEEIESQTDRLAREAEIRGDLRRYLPAPLVERIVAREQSMALGGEHRDLTVLFADVVGFTPLTETLKPQVVVQLLNELFTITTEIVFRHGGTVDKFIGDCVMAMWGAPQPREDHACAALRAADEIFAWLETGNQRWRRIYGVTVELAIGVNSGTAVVGNVGSDVRMAYTAIGDCVNVAARLETIARPGQILVGERTVALAGDDFEFARLAETVQDGRAQPIPIFEVIR